MSSFDFKFWFLFMELICWIKIKSQLKLYPFLRQNEKDNSIVKLHLQVSLWIVILTSRADSVEGLAYLNATYGLWGAVSGLSLSSWAHIRSPCSLVHLAIGDPPPKDNNFHMRIFNSSNISLQLQCMSKLLLSSIFLNCTNGCRLEYVDIMSTYPNEPRLLVSSII